jgi:hypothetical protein
MAKKKISKKKPRNPNVPVGAFFLSLNIETHLCWYFSGDSTYNQIKFVQEVMQIQSTKFKHTLHYHHGFISILCYVSSNFYSAGPET